MIILVLMFLGVIALILYAAATFSTWAPVVEEYLNRFFGENDN